MVFRDLIKNTGYRRKVWFEVNPRNLGSRVVVVSNNGISIRNAFANYFTQHNNFEQTKRVHY